MIFEDKLTYRHVRVKGVILKIHGVYREMGSSKIEARVK